MFYKNKQSKNSGFLFIVIKYVIDHEKNLKFIFIIYFFKLKEAQGI